MDTLDRFTHVIFDLDGLLLDTETSYTIAFEELLDKRGKKFSLDVKEKMMGKKLEESIKLMMNIYDLQNDSCDNLEKELKDTLKPLLMNCKLMPGAEKLISYLSILEIPMAIATGSNKSEFILKSSHHEILKKIPIVITSDHPDVKSGKPSPDIFNVAHRSFKKTLPLNMSTILVFEDALNGIEAANSLKMTTVLVSQHYYNLYNDANNTFPYCFHSNNLPKLIIPSLEELDFTRLKFIKNE